MQFPFEARAVQVWTDEEDQRLRRVSTLTLQYMYDHGLSLERHLRHHGGDLAFLAQEERDLLEAMRLDARLNTIKRNVQRASRRNARMDAEIVRRQAGET
jgi:hypothetical protein